MPTVSVQRQPCSQIGAAHSRQCLSLKDANSALAQVLSRHPTRAQGTSPFYLNSLLLARRRVPFIAHSKRHAVNSLLGQQYSTQGKRRGNNSIRCNAALSVALPFAGDVDAWRLIIERATVFFAILVAHLAGSSQPTWGSGSSGRLAFLPSRKPSQESPLVGSVSYTSTADWGADWGDQWGGETSADQIAERRSSSESATTSEPAPVFPPRIWGDISDKLRAPPVARKGALVETVLATSPELSVQGLAREPRRRLLAAALGALRESVELLPEEMEELGVPEWRAASEGVLVAAVRGAKSAWLEETDPELGSRKRVRDNLGLSENVVEQSEPLLAEVNEKAVESSWMQSLLGRKPGLGVTQAGLTPVETEAERSKNGAERQTGGSDARVPQREQGSRAEWGGWGAPVFRVAEETDSSLDGVLQKELALMGDKLPLYEELLFYLRFKKCRQGTRLPPGAFTKHASKALEDLVLAVADAVASDCMSLVGYNPRSGVKSLTPELLRSEEKDESGQFSGRVNDPNERGNGLEGGLADGLRDDSRKVEQLMQRFLHPRLRSTRALERFRNEVSLRRFLRTKLASVSALYEDRYDLWGLRQQPIAGGSEPLEVPDSKGRRTSPRTRRKPLASFAGLGLLGRKRQAEMAEEDWEVVVVGRSMPCRRIAELRRLGGWQLRYSMILEFLDVAAPILNGLLMKMGDWISFLLVTMIGRSLGLIYKGIKQSLRRS
ncbi:hypothetical protein KFL_001190130 [Klebsormidium nitens]|uniref:Uncharacterized protein n=1 Tax=Klebsormidium nitens TaxID=105231 RepID=A0A0U9HJQ3_KLENI|nr:hypothetical protein KFL_001190130 [Klebsormidium nitens]|eukprot:GAQ82670.1 hypothetical protein KFL_001190130 [Klebsormidium nitens]